MALGLGRLPTLETGGKHVQLHDPRRGDGYSEFQIILCIDAVCEGEMYGFVLVRRILLVVTVLLCTHMQVHVQQCTCTFTDTHIL